MHLGPSITGFSTQILEAEHTPPLAKVLATAILEAVADAHKLPHVMGHAKKLKLSPFHAIAAAKQPSKALQTATVPEFSHVVVVSIFLVSFLFK